MRPATTCFVHLVQVSFLMTMQDFGQSAPLYLLPTPELSYPFHRTSVYSNRRHWYDGPMNKLPNVQVTSVGKPMKGAVQFHPPSDWVIITVVDNSQKAITLDYQYLPLTHPSYVGAIYNTKWAPAVYKYPLVKLHPVWTPGVPYPYQVPGGSILILRDPEARPAFVTNLIQNLPIVISVPDVVFGIAGAIGTMVSYIPFVGSYGVEEEQQEYVLEYIPEYPDEEEFVQKPLPVEEIVEGEDEPEVEDEKEHNVTMPDNKPEPPEVKPSGWWSWLFPRREFIREVYIISYV